MDEMTPEERRRLSRQLDRVEGMLEKCIKEDKKLRKQRRAEWRAKMDKLKPPDERRPESGNQECGT
jgi:hypothetical protein